MSGPSPAICQRCGACCSILIDGELIACRHLQVEGGKFACAIYDVRPAVCRDYDCTREDLQGNALVRDRVLAAMDVAA
jgi:Fe-S-cluster containining protein